MASEWKFTQQGGARRELTLAGASAPHGRPRQGPVVTDGIKLRRQRVYYPDGANVPPTTHIFGTAWKDWELKGRFNDKWLGRGGTKAAIRDWQLFVAESQSVKITWGDIISANGIVDSFEPGRESEFEGTYSIVVLIDNRDIGGAEPPFRRNRSTERGPLALAELFDDETDRINIPNLRNAGDLKPTFLESLDDLVSSVNTFSASLVNVAGEIDVLAEGTLDQFERLRAGVMQARTAVNRLLGTIETTENDAALLARASDSDVQWFAARVESVVAMTRMLAILEEIDRETEIARRSNVLAIYTAVIGDSWESIATRFYGSPDNAGALRDANGVLYGAMPVSGRVYQVPAIG